MSSSKENFLDSNLNASKYIESKFMENFVKDIYEALKLITDLFKSNDISFTAIGGVARNEYSKDIRMTQDIDLLVDKKDIDKVKHLPIGYIRDISTNNTGRVLKLHDPKTIVDIIYSGEKAGNSQGIEYKDPKSVSEYHAGIPFLTLKDLIEYKLSSGLYGKRYKDFGDIQDLIISNKLSITYAKDNGFRQDLIKQYENLWNDTVI